MNTAVQIPYAEETCPLDNAVIVGGRFANTPAKENMLRALGAFRGPPDAREFVAAPDRFSNLVGVINQAMAAGLRGLGLVPVVVPSKSMVLVLGELARVDLDQVGRMTGARTRTLTNYPGRLGWYCNQPHCVAYVRREIESDRSFIDGHSPEAIAKANELERARQASGRIDAGPSLDLRLRCANVGCDGAMLVPRSFDFERALRFVEASGGSIEQTEGGLRYWCGVRCRVEGERSIARRPPELPPATREDMIARYGRHHVPESRAAAVYRDVHGHDPGEGPAPADASPEAASAVRATRSQVRKGSR